MIETPIGRKENGMKSGKKEGIIESSGKGREGRVRKKEEILSHKSCCGHISCSVPFWDSAEIASFIWASFSPVSPLFLSKLLPFPSPLLVAILHFLFYSLISLLPSFLLYFLQIWRPPIGKLFPFLFSLSSFTNSCFSFTFPCIKTPISGLLLPLFARLFFFFF